MFRMAIITLFLVVWPLSVQPQQSPLFCKPHENILATLNEKYGEYVMAHAVDNKGRIIEVFRNPKTKTWTVIVTVANNLSCVVGAGQQMEVPDTDNKKCVSAVNEI
jgi:hypothetical protein